jgi:alkylation response protein AidB-like acyl-CoA dehydrogenase
MSHPPSATALAELTQALAANAERYDRSGQFPADNFSLLHRHGLLSLTVPRALGGGGADLATARQVVAAVGKGDPSTALILVMQYLQHFRLQDEARWPEHLRLQVARDAVANGALINAFRVEPEHTRHQHRRRLGPPGHACYLQPRGAVR